MGKQWRCSGKTLTQSLAQKAHKGGTGHTPPLPTLRAHSLLPMIDAQIAAERKHLLPQAVCRWIVALL